MPEREPPAAAPAGCGESDATRIMGSASPVDDPNQQRRLKMVALSATNFALVSTLFLLYAAIGTVPWSAPLAYLAVCVAGSLGFWAMVRSGRNLRLPDPNMFAAQMAFAAVVLFGAFVAMPQLTGAHLCNLFVTAIFGAVQFTARQFRLATAVASLATAAAIWAQSDRLRLPSDHPLELVLLSAYVTLSLLRFGVIATHVGALRGKLREKNLALEASLERITHLADHDALTGALSRRGIAQRMEQAIGASPQRPAEPMTAVLLDLDHFKRINDQHGHLVGDAVLQLFAAVVTATLRRHDLLGRWGGEEFVLFLPGEDGARALQIMQRVHDALAAHDWQAVAPGLAVSTSAGVAQHQPAEPLDAWLQRADQALYTAKARGRRRTELAPDAAPPADARASLQQASAELPSPTS